MLLARDARTAKHGIAKLLLSVSLFVCNVEVPWSHRLRLLQK